MEKLRQHIEDVTHLNNEEFELIRTFFSAKRVLKNQYLIHEGDEVKFEYFVVSGIYKVFYFDSHDKEYIVQFAEENKWMSDYAAFFKQKQASMYIECIEEGEVLCLTLDGREKLSSDIHKMELFFRAKLTDHYVELERRIKLLLSNTPRERFEEFARLNPHLIQRVSKKIIAKYLGTCRETLSRLYT